MAFLKKDLDQMREKQNAILTRVMEMESMADTMPDEPRRRIEAQTRNIRSSITEIYNAAKSAVLI